MRVGSAFSGVGGLDLGLENAGHRLAFQIEIDAYRREVLARHWPDVPRHDDVRTFDPDPWRGRIDLLCGGFPCQDVSRAGPRVGLDGGTKSVLFFEFARLADRAIDRGGWVLVENVPGLLASNRGRDFAVVLAQMADLGFHDLAWRVLDSQYFGVPQRRPRVYIVGRRSTGDRAASVLLESQSGGGHPAPRKEPRKGVAGSVADGARNARTLLARGQRFDGESDDFVVTFGQRISGPVGSRSGGGFRTTDLDGHGAYVGAPVDAHRVREVAGPTGRVDPDRIDPPPDTCRYGAIGDAVTVPVAEWIGRRLEAYGG